MLSPAHGPLKDQEGLPNQHTNYVWRFGQFKIPIWDTKLTNGYENKFFFSGHKDSFMNCSDIMCIQEHHLHEFEKAELEDLFPEFSCDA